MMLGNKYKSLTFCFRLHNRSRKTFVNFSRNNFSSEAGVVKSKGARLEIPKNTSLTQFLWKNLDKKANNVAVVCSETKRSYTYEQVYKKSLSTSKFLKEGLNVKSQETACILMQNLPEFPIALIGAIQAGMKVTTCNPAYTPYEIQRQIENSNSSVIFTSKTFLPKVRQALLLGHQKLPVVLVNDGQNATVTEDTIDFDQVASGETWKAGDDIVNSDDVVLLPYSSGTTGLPKGVQLTHYNIFANLNQLAAPDFSLQKQNESSDQEVIPAFLPFFHIYGMMVVLLYSLSMGSKVVTMPTFGTESFIKIMKQFNPTIIYCVPLVVNMAINHEKITYQDLSQIKVFFCGAAPLGVADVQRFEDKTKGKVLLRQGYGMTETSPLTLHQTDNFPNGVKVGGSGLLVPNTDAKIVPADGSLEGLGPNQSGELLIRGPQVMKGYFNNDKATSEVLLDGGWIRTGDIAYYDEDQHFYITDRMKELIKVKGFQVAPAELEEILRDHPAVEDAAVIGVPHPTQDEAPKAFVVLKKNNSIDASKLQEHVAGKVSKHKHLVGGVTFIDAIPKNPSGKILRKELRKL